MKKILFICFLALVSWNSFSQNNQFKINYSLEKTFSLESVGGDLVVNEVPICPDKNLNKQVLFSGTSQGTFFVNIDNRGGGNNCVTLVVETANGTSKVDIPSDSETGVLKFLKVKNAYLKITKKEKNLNDISKSVGTATIWF